MKHGARNDLQGEVVEVKKGQVMCQVKVDVPGPSTISSVMTLDSLAALNIKEGSKVRAVVKAVNVLLIAE